MKKSEECQFELALIKDFECLSDKTKEVCVSELKEVLNRLAFYKNEDIECNGSIKEQLMMTMVKYKNGELSK